MHQNVVDGYIGRMTVPGGATVKVSELTSRTTLAIMPDGAYRRSSNGDFIEVNGAVLYLPLKGSKDSDYTAATIDHGKQRIKIVVNRARKAKKERDARTLFQSLQPSDLRTENGVDLRQWVAGDDVDSDALVREELEGARIGFRGHQAGIPTDLQTWNAGEDVDLDRAVRDELDSYRDRFWN
jgi:CRISPR/Cas system CMR-associated protein Cmr3 (group 5 of RAMP superfamily)